MKPPEPRDLEVYSGLRVPPNAHLVLRVDGRAFTNLTRRLGMEKPYDRRFAEAMAETAVRLIRDSGLGVTLVYGFSDELNLLIPRDRIPFSGRVEKLTSVSASCAASYLQGALRERFGERVFAETISFDSRCVVLTEEDVVRYFKWRQDEAWRNHLNSYAYWALRRKGLSPREAAERLRGMKAHDVHELLFREFGINLGRTPVWQRRGFLAYRVRVREDGVERCRVTRDWAPPRFHEGAGRRILRSCLRRGFVELDPAPGGGGS